MVPCGLRSERRHEGLNRLPNERRKTSSAAALRGAATAKSLEVHRSVLLEKSRPSSSKCGRIFSFQGDRTEDRRSCLLRSAQGADRVHRTVRIQIGKRLSELLPSSAEIPKEKNEDTTRRNRFVNSVLLPYPPARKPPVRTKSPNGSRTAPSGHCRTGSSSSVIGFCPLEQPPSRSFPVRAPHAIGATRPRRAPCGRCRASSHGRGRRRPTRRL